MWQDYADDLGIEVDTLDACSITSGGNLFQVDHESFKSAESELAEVNVYADGSKIDQNVGSGFVAMRDKLVVRRECCRLPDKSTVFQAEINAIQMATEFISQEVAQTVKIFIDSQAAIRALEARLITSKLVYDTVSKLNRVGRDKRITLAWTKAHVGTLGNELADSAAKEGATGGTCTIITTPKIEVKNRITETFYRMWGEEWHEYKGGRMAKEFYRGPDSNKAKYVYKLSRMELSRYLRIIAGHNGLFYFCSKVDQEISPFCRFCNEKQETFLHYINDCPPLRKVSQDLSLIHI